MQYDHVLKKLNFNLLTPRVGVGGSAGIVFATMLHVAAPVIPLNLIYNNTMFWKSLILPLTPPPKSTQGSDKGLRSKVRFDMFLIYCTSVCICYHVAAFAIPFDMQHDNVLKKFNFNLLTPRALGGGGSAGEIFATIRLHLWFHLSWYATWPCFEKVNFDILTPPHGSGGGRRGSAGKIYATTFPHSWFYLIWYAIWPCSGKVEFWPSDPRVRGWGWAELRGQNICYHVAAFMFPFSVICNMIMFWKNWILTFWPHPLSPPRGVWHRPSIKNRVWYVSYLL